MFSCPHTIGCEAYSFTTDGYLIFNVRTHLGAWRAHKWGCGVAGVRHKQVCSTLNSSLDGQTHCSLPCTPWGSNPGSSDLNIELHPLCSHEGRPSFMRPRYPAAGYLLYLGGYSQRRDGSRTPGNKRLSVIGGHYHHHYHALLPPAQRTQKEETFDSSRSSDCGSVQDWSTCTLSRQTEQSAAVFISGRIGYPPPLTSLLTSTRRGEGGWQC